MGEMAFQLFPDAPGSLIDGLESLSKLPADSTVISRVLQDGFIELSAMVDKSIEIKDFPPPLSGSLVYCDGHIVIVQGRQQTDASLDKWEAITGKKIAEERRNAYKNKGGALQLEGRCRVIGALASGREVLDRIAALPSSPQMKPLRTIHFSVKIPDLR